VIARMMLRFLVEPIRKGMLPTRGNLGGPGGNPLGFLDPSRIQAKSKTNKNVTTGHICLGIEDKIFGHTQKMF
jgi:hypothetical protein